MNIKKGNLLFNEMKDIAKNSIYLCRCSNGWGSLHSYGNDFIIVWDQLQEHEGHQLIKFVDPNEKTDRDLVGKLYNYAEYTPSYLEKIWTTSTNSREDLQQSI